MLRSRILLKTPRYFLESLFGSVVLVLLFWIFQSKQLIWFTADSGTYLLNSFELKVPGDRTVFYSLFIYLCRNLFGFFGWNSLFPVVFLPLWLVVFSMMKLLSSVFLTQKYPLKYWIVITATIAGIWMSGALWILLQIMPDSFTSLVLLSSILWIESTSINHKSASWFWGIIAVISAVMHNGNLIPFSGIIILNILFNKNILNSYYKIIYKKQIMFSLLPWFLVFISNFWGGNGCTISKNAPVFLMAKMSENGVLSEYLDKNCHKQKHPICQYKDDLPEHAWDFIWPDDGIHMKLGGWHKTDSLYKQTLMCIFSDPVLMGSLLKKSIIDTWKQVILWGVGDGIVPSSNNSTIHKIITEDYHLADHNSRVDFSSINSNSRLLLIGFSAMLLIVLSCRKISVTISKRRVLFFLFIIGFCFLQAFATGAMANILMRLNMRSVWVIMPLLLFFLIGEIISVVYKREIWFLRKTP